MRGFELAWASADETATIRSVAAENRRQVMNMSRATARLIRVRAEGRLAGWMGLDLEHDPALPELFSIYVEPPLRRARVGRCLRLTAALYLEHRGVRTAYSRLSRSHDPVAARAWSPFTEPMSAAELPPHFVDACRACNLYERECREREFLAVDVEAFRAHSAVGLSSALVEEVRRLAVEGRPFELEGLLSA